MILVSANVGPFKSVEKTQLVTIQEDVTVLVGMNEAGKTVFLQALQKANDVLEAAKFDYIDDYPRKDLNLYEPKHAKTPADVVVLRYRLNADEVQQLNAAIGSAAKAPFEFTITHKYNNNRTIGISVDEAAVVKTLAATKGISTDIRDAIKKAATIREIPEKVEAISHTEDDEKLLKAINARIAKADKASGWTSVASFEAWQWSSGRVPKFLYFGDYQVLPSKMNLADLSARAADKAHPMSDDYRGILALLRMANIDLEALAKPGQYEALISRIEAVSIRLTDQIMEFWKQNENLEVKVDIRNDPNDSAPYNNGPNLYIRIANQKHRGVSTPFRQRSKGFTWFFSFLVWFDSVQHQIANGEDDIENQLVLLLDEPGLNLHALAQADFLRYIDNLATKHQVIYSTHSPFMVHSDRLHQVRVVEDRNKIGTHITDNVSWTDERTIFPLQAALGWTIAQNLFISERNLLVEGPADLVYLQVASALLEATGKNGLRADITIVPTGGLDKVVTFVALLGANKLKLVVLHDYRGAPEQKLVDLMRQRMIAAKAILDCSQFRDLEKLGISGIQTDLEDLLPVPMYLDYFNRAYKRELAGNSVQETDLPPGDRIVDRIERFIAQKGISLRPSGGFNHYAPARVFAASPPNQFDPDTQSRFEALFQAIDAGI
jgi:hypothetical protein